MGGVGFVDISLVEDPVVERGGYGACGTGKGRNDGKRGGTVFWGDTKPVVVVCGATGWRVNWIRLQGRDQRGGVGGYLILWVWGLRERDEWW
eukprot:scaffold63753_cov53-Attheya_sp.AAC.1